MIRIKAVFITRTNDK